MSMGLRTLDNALIDEIIKRIKGGCPVTVMCDSVGLSTSTYHFWMATGKKEDSDEVYKSFRHRVLAAKADYLWSCVKDIKEAGEKSWQANAWLLERKNPENFNEKYKCKEYPQKLNELPLEKRGDAIYDMMLKGEISQYEAHTFVDILAKMAAIEENVKLKEQLFEIQQKLEGK